MRARHRPRRSQVASLQARRGWLRPFATTHLASLCPGLAQGHARVRPPPDAHAHAVLRAQGRARLRHLVADELEGISAEQHREAELRLHVREVVAEAYARPGAEWQVRVAMARRL